MLLLPASAHFGHRSCSDNGAAGVGLVVDHPVAGAIACMVSNLAMLIDGVGLDEAAVVRPLVTSSRQCVVWSVRSLVLQLYVSLADPEHTILDSCVLLLPYQVAAGWSQALAGR
jgi:hypothetical protein